MKIRRKLVAVALTLGCGIGASFAADKPAWKAPSRAAQTSNPVVADAKSIEKGKGLYAKECASCHGNAGKGDGPDSADLSRPPTDFTVAQSRQQTDGELFWKIAEGRKPMPRYGKMLDDEERWHVVNFIRSLAPKSAE